MNRLVYSMNSTDIDDLDLKKHLQAFSRVSGVLESEKWWIGLRNLCWAPLFYDTLRQV